MTGTDGAAVSSYAFDDFGRGIDPFTGRLKEAGNKHTKHAYTTEGNIIQPFAFTGYQEDEVSGLMFAQARYYDATRGRFQSEDRVKGFKNASYTLNHYSYCFGNPVGFSDRNGNWPSWGDVWDATCDAWDATCEAVGDGIDAAADFCVDTYNGVKTWVKDNTDFVDVNEISSDKGLVGPYMTETTTTKTGNTKLFTLTTKNGEFSSFGVNLPEISIFGYDYKTSFSVGSDGLSNTTTVKHTGDDGSTDSVTVKTSAASISGETASTSGDTTTGSGFRLSLNPTKSNDVYSYNTTKVDEYTTKRTEGGWTINSGITDLVIAAAAAAIYFGAGAGAAAAGGGGAVIYEFPVKEAGENAAMFFLSLFGLEKLMNECDESV